MPATSHVTAIILAAGRSRRMGAANKLLLPFRDSTVLGGVLQTVRTARVEDVVVVTGHEAEQIGAEADRYGMRTVHNSAYGSGMASSISAGVRSASPETDGFLILLGDVPTIPQQVVHEVRQAFEAAEQDAPIIVTAVRERPGPPVLFHRTYRDELVVLDGDTGARPILARHPESVIAIKTNPGILLDIDTPAAYEAACRQQR